MPILHHGTFCPTGPARCKIRFVTAFCRSRVFLAFSPRPSGGRFHVERSLDRACAAAAPASEVPPPRPALRLWPAVVMLAIFWLAIVSGWQLEMSPLVRFLSRLALHALLLVGFAGWWLSRRALSWTERLQAVLVFIAGSVAVLLIADPSINGFTIFLGAMPIVFTAGTAALAATRSQRSSIRRTAVSAAILAVLFSFALLRSDGIDGWQHAEFNWRWQPTSEQMFLASHQASERCRSNASAMDAATRRRPGLPRHASQQRGHEHRARHRLDSPRAEGDLAAAPGTRRGRA